MCKMQQDPHGVARLGITNFRFVSTVATVFLLGLTASGIIGAAGIGAAPSAAVVDRLRLRDAILQVGRLKLDFSLATLLADSIPPAIASFLLDRAPELIGLDAACLPLDSTRGYPSHGFPGQRLYVFSGEASLLYNIVVKRERASWHAIWSRTDPGCLPQPGLWVTRLGIEGDSCVTIGMTGIISATSYKSYTLMLWNGRTGRDLFGGGGDSFDEEDLNHDGVSEVIVGREGLHASKKYPSREIYYFDAAAKTYRSSRDATRKAIPK